LIDRAIDQWEAAYGRSTVKNTIAALVPVLDEAVRDGPLVRNPARIGLGGVSSAGLPCQSRLPRVLAISPAGRAHVEPADRGSRAEGWSSGLGRLRDDLGDNRVTDQ
jgi:hypothetical protein